MVAMGQHSHTPVYTSLDSLYRNNTPLRPQSAVVHTYQRDSQGWSEVVLEEGSRRRRARE